MSRDIYGLLELWARWRIDRANGECGWPPVNLLGRMLDGMPSTKCIACNGSGIRSVGRAGGGCSVCGGSGKVNADPRGVKINPALIRSTVPGGSIPGFYHVETHRLFQRITWIVITMLTKDQYAVVMLEYIIQSRNRNDAIKELGITHQRYNRLLDEAVGVIDANIRGEY